MKTSTHTKIAAVTVLLVLLAGAAQAQAIQTWKSGKTTVTLSNNGTLRVSAIGVFRNENLAPAGIMKNYRHDDEPPWHDYKSLITAVIIEKGVIDIGYMAFYGCENIKSVTIPNSVIGIGSYAFHGCKSLTSLTIPKSVQVISGYTFSNCPGLTSINVSKGNKSLRSIDGVLFSINHREKQSLVQQLTGKNNETLTLYRYPAGRQGAYTIPGNVTRIIANAFGGSTGLTSLTIPGSVKIDSYGELLASDCINLTSINVDNDNPHYSSIDGVLFNKDATTLIRYPEGKRGAYTIPNGVTEIGDMAFYNNTNLTSVTIPDGVTHIVDEAFVGCTNLISVKIPSSVTSIGAFAFGWCKALPSVTIPSSVTSIEELAFDFCDNLTSVTSLNPIPPDIDRDGLGRGLPENITLYVPNGSIDAYRNAAGWKDFGRIKPIASGSEAHFR